MKHHNLNSIGDITLDGGGSFNEVSTDGSLSGNSDTVVPSEKAVKTYADDTVIPVGTPMWFYENSPPTGWVLDSPTSDNIIAVKGGSTYTTGGSQQGSWTITGITSANESS